MSALVLLTVLAPPVAAAADDVVGAYALEAAFAASTSVLVTAVSECTCTSGGCCC